MRAMSLRIGVLGAARIAPAALLKPATRADGVEVRAVAARDRGKATRFAEKHGIPVVHASYDDLLADPDVDAVYNPLPNGLHGHWTIRAIEAGKHVLCEKPFTANAAEAEAVAAVAARRPDVVVMEAFHYRYHPLTARVLDIIASGEIGDVRDIRARMVIPLLRRNDIRWRLDLAGGALMDVGCYSIHQVRTFAGEEPEVTSAQATCSSPDVDRWATAEFRFADGRTAGITCALLSASFLRLDTRITGTEGDIRVRNPIAPQYFARVTVRRGGAKRSEGTTRDASYLFQLLAFRDAAAGGAPPLTGVADAVGNMRVIDAVYRAARLPVREPSAVI
jgi:predicted dehydrogenase